MIRGAIKNNCLPVVVAIIIAFLLSGCAVEYEVKLKADPEDAGAVSGSGAYREGETVTIKAEAEEGYTFDRWKVKGTELEHSDKETELKVEEDKELVAEFSRKTPTINLECDIEEDSLSGGGTYEYGETVEVEAGEIEGYRFKNWLEDDEVVSEDKTYQFTAVENRTLTAVRELETAVREMGHDLEGLVLKDDLNGYYLLPIIENDKYGLIDTEGENVVRVSELNCALIAFGSFWDHPGVRPYRVGETDPLILPLDIDGNRKRIAFNEKGQLITTLLREDMVSPWSHYNNYGLIIVEDGRYGFIDFEQNPLLELKYEEVSFLRFIQEKNLLKIKQDGLYGLADSASGDIVVEPQYEKLESTGWVEHKALKGKKNDQVYLLDLSGEIIKKLDIDQYGLFNKGVCPVKKDGSWGLIDTQGEVLLEPRYDKIEASTGRTPPDDAAARFENNSRTGYLDSNGEVLFEGEIEETIGNYFIFTEEGKAGIKSIEGEVIKEPVFDDYRKSRPPGTCDPTAGHVAEDYTLFKKDGLWGVFTGGKFLSDFKFKEIGGYWDLPMEFNDVPQIVVKKEGSVGEGLYDLTRGEFIITPGEYGGFNRSGNDKGFGYLKNGRVLVKEDGKYGFLDRDGREVIEIQYDRATDFENEAAGVIKDGKLSFIDREGNQLVDPVDVDCDDNFSFQLEYLEGPEVYKGPNYSYFDHDDWIWKPQ